MTKSRLEMLEEMIAQDPNNSFVRYGLAQEYANNGRLDQAVAEFRRLAEANPDYTAAYFHGGRALHKLGRIEEAREMYQRGIEACTRTGNAHALSEMQAALDELG
jgi:tetratricopeptide (TPR) repeat protein